MKDILKHYNQPSFLICVAVLAICTAGMRYTIKKLNITLTKEKIELIKSFDDLDENALFPYKVVRKDKIENPDTLESLGTEDYIQWTLEDTTKPATSPTRYVSLFLTYYTGINDRIPHVPDECYLGAGNVKDDLKDTKIDIDYPTSEYAKDGVLSIPTRQLTFIKKSTNIWVSDRKLSVMYFFKVNDEFAGTRTSARNILGKNLLGKYSYFSKVEWRFFGTTAYASPEEAIEASIPLLEKVVPILDSQHWPNLTKAQEGLEE